MSNYYLLQGSTNRRAKIDEPCSDLCRDTISTHDCPFVFTLATHRHEPISIFNRNQTNSLLSFYYADYCGEIEALQSLNGHRPTGHISEIRKHCIDL
jgi:hypothetical protein